MEKRMNHQCCDRKQLCIATDSYQCGCPQCRPETKIKCFRCNYVFMTENEVDYEQASEGLPTWWALDDAEPVVELTPEQEQNWREIWIEALKLPTFQINRNAIMWPVPEQREGS